MMHKRDTAATGAGAGRSRPAIGAALALALTVLAAPAGHAQTGTTDQPENHVIVVQPDLAYQATMGMTNALLGAATGDATTAETPYPGAPIGNRNPYQPSFGGPAGTLAHAGSAQYTGLTGRQPTASKPRKRPEPGNYLYAKKPKKKSAATPAQAPAPSAAARPAPGAVYTGMATALSGSTLDIDGHTLALAGVAAPAAGAVCAGGKGTSWRCGQAATKVLADMLERGMTRCVVTRSGTPPEADCSLMGQSINQSVVGRH